MLTPGHKAWDVIPVSQFMSMEVVGVPDSMPLDTLARLLADHAISGAPVLDRSERVVGVVSIKDVLFATALPEDSFYAPWTEPPVPTPSLPQEMSGMKVSDVMTRRVIAVAEDAPIEEAARLLREHHIHRLLVTRDRQRVVGIITTFDLLRAVEVLASRLPA